MAKSLSEFLSKKEEYYDHFDEITVSESGKAIYIDGKQRTAFKAKEELKEDIKMKLAMEARDLWPVFMLAPPQDQDAFIEELVESYIDFKTPKKQYRESKMGTGFLLAIDITTNDRIIVREPTMQATGIDPNAFASLTPPESVKEIHEAAIPCRIEFDPQNLDSHWLRQEDHGGVGMEVNVFNAYTAPSYRFLEADVPDTLAEVDKELDLYFRTLANHDPKTLHILLSWMKVAVESKCSTVLVLVGLGGTGKSFYGQLLGHLVGYREYFTPAQNEFFSSRFVSQLGVKRAILVDEGDMPETSHVNNAKKYVENYFSSERKGKDADPMKLINASLVVTNNNFDRMKLRPEERKFTVPDVAKIKLSTVFDTPTHWEEFTKRVTQDEKLILFYNFLENYETDWTPYTDYRGDTFWRMVVEGGLTPKERAIYDRISDMNEPEMDIMEFVRSINRNNKDFRVTRKCVQKLVTEFEDGGNSIGFVDEDTIYTVLNSQHCSDDEMLDELDLL